MSLPSLLFKDRLSTLFVPEDEDGSRERDTL